MKRAYVGVDMGGTKIAGAIVTADSSIHFFHKVPTLGARPASGFTPELGSESAAEVVLDNLFGLIHGLIADAGEAGYAVEGISIASAGPLDRESGMILSPPNLPLRNVPVAQLCQDRFGIPTFLERDTNAAAFGEYRYGAAGACRPNDPMLYIAVGTGIGAGLVSGGKVYSGSAGLALEIGHITIDPDPASPVCGCGARGCFEALASGGALEKAARALGLWSDQDDAQTKVNVVQALSEVSSGDPRAAALLDKFSRHLGIGISSALNLLDPACLVLAGGVVSGARRAGLPILDRALKEVEARSFRRFSPRGHIPVVFSELGDKAAILGSVELARAARG